MGDEGQGMDPCECVWGHELAMRRLLNVIRNSQADCTDNECFEEGFRNQSPDSSTLMLTFFMIAALFMYYLRPRPQRITDDVAKPNNNNNGNDSNGSPPNPPSIF